MGTRNLTCVYSEGELKMAQYGQWDGYFESLGKEILIVLKESTIEEMKEAMKKTDFLTAEKQEEIWKAFITTLDTTEEELEKLKKGLLSMKHADKWKEFAPSINRDNSGALMLAYILTTDKDKVWLKNDFDFGYDSLYCEYAYVIDLDNEKFEIYTGFNKEKQEETARWYIESPEDTYYGVKKIKEYDLNDLPEEEVFLNELIHIEKGEE